MTFCFYDDLHFNQKSFFIANRRPCCLQTVFPVQFQASVQLSVPVRAVRQRGMRAGDIHQKRRRASVVVVVDIVDIVVVVVGPPPLPPNHIEYPITSNLVAPKWTAPGRPCLSLSLSLSFFFVCLVPSLPFVSLIGAVVVVVFVVLVVVVGVVGRTVLRACFEYRPINLGVYCISN